MYFDQADRFPKPTSYGSTTTKPIWSAKFTEWKCRAELLHHRLFRGIAVATNADRVLDFLRLIAPRRATNEEISGRTGIRPHQQVFQITQRLAREGTIRSMLSGKEWEFWVEEKGLARPIPTVSASARPKSELADGKAIAGLAREFELAAVRTMSGYYGVELSAGEVPGVPKRFDLVSADKAIVGDAKFYTMVQGQGLPPAKFSIIAEHVWLLEKTRAPTKFLVFGNDRRVPEQWLKRYSGLVVGIDFFFLATDGKLDRLRVNVV